MTMDANYNANIPRYIEAAIVVTWTTYLYTEQPKSVHCKRVHIYLNKYTMKKHIDDKYGYVMYVYTQKYKHVYIYI